MARDNTLKRQVFISYVKDNSIQVDSICAAFAENNIEYWRDKKDIDPGKFWKDAIKAAINNGGIFFSMFL